MGYAVLNARNRGLLIANINDAPITKSSSKSGCNMILDNESMSESHRGQDHCHVVLDQRSIVQSRNHNDCSVVFELFPRDAQLGLDHVSPDGLHVGEDGRPRAVEAVVQVDLSAMHWKMKVVPNLWSSERILANDKVGLCF